MLERISSLLSAVLRSVAAVAVGLAVGLAFTRLSGESPWHVFEVLVKSAFGSPYDIGMTLFYATPLVFTGLSVAVAFQAGLFNIGAEGQLVVGALASAAVGMLAPSLPAWVAVPVAILVSFAAGAAWGMIPGWLRARRGSHEVINTIMFNFIAAGVTSWLTLGFLKNPDSQNPETAEAGAGYVLRAWDLFEGAPIGGALIVAVLAVLLVWFLLNYTVIGYELRATGSNPTAARVAGIRSARAQILAMAIAGGLAGLVAVPEVLGNAHKFRMGFSPEYGFIGIAVALLARNHPVGVLFSALLFGALHKGAGDLDLETETVTREIAWVLQACVILSVSADGVWEWFGRHARAARRRLSNAGSTGAGTKVSDGRTA